MILKNQRLEELCSKVTSGGTPNTRKPEYYGGNIPWLKTQEVDFNRIYETETFIAEEGLNNSSAKWIPENSVIVAMYGATAGRIAINKIPLTTNQACCNLIIDPEKADYRYIYYNLLSRFDSIANMAVGGAQQNLNAGMIKDLPIDLPDLPTQKAIAEILSSLDDKIELNNQINQNLEALAQALFKQWFVDFEFPSENGEPYKSSGGELVDSELGEIPKGWIYKQIVDVCRVINGRAFKNTEFEISGTPIIRIQNLNGGSNYVFSNLILEKDKYVERDDLIFAWSATFGPFIWRGDKSIYHYHIWKLDCFQKNFKYYLFHHLKRDSSNVSNLGTGSIFTHITKGLMESQKVLVPEESVLNQFHEVMLSIDKKVSVLIDENRSLSNLRDTLLPKLISGELELIESLLEQTL